MAFDDNKTRTWDRTTLNDGIYFEDEFTRVYGNLTDVDGRVTNVDDNLSTLTQYVYTLIAGKIQGGIFWDQSGGGKGATALGPGRYEVDGKINTFSSGLTLNPVTHCYGNDVQEDDLWYYTLMDSTGVLRQQIATGDSVVSGLAVNSVSTPGGGIYQISFRNSPDLSGVSVAMSFRSDDMGGGNSGIFDIIAVDAAGFTIQVKNSRGGVLMSGTDPVGTGEIFERVSLLNTPNPVFDVTRQGYYDGDRRILGVDYYDSVRSYRWLNAYKSGYDKNDNELFLKEWSGYDSVDTHVLKYANILREWGNDYTYDPTNGTAVTFHRNGKVHSFTLGYAYSSDGDWRGISINATPAERQTWFYAFPDHIKRTGWCYIAPSKSNSITCTSVVRAGDVMRVHGLADRPSGSATYEESRFIFEPE